VGAGEVSDYNHLDTRHYEKIAQIYNTSIHTHVSPERPISHQNDKKSKKRGTLRRL